MAITHAEVIISDGDKRLGRSLIEPGEYIIGSDPSCDIQADAPDVEARHARLTVTEQGVELEDLGSSSGTFVESERVERAVRLDPRRKIKLGNARIEIKLRRDTDEPGQPKPAPASHPSATRLGNYELGEELGHGGMGAVLEAKDPNLHRTVALKVILARDQPRKEQLLRFIHEAQLTGQLEHPNIVPVHELGVDDQDQLFYTMKLVKGLTLHQVLTRIQRGDPAILARYPLGHLLTIYQKLCDGVAFAHSMGVVHRDLKPENVMIGDYGEVLVMDWGLAKVISDQSSVMSTPSQSQGVTDNCSLVTDNSAVHTLAGRVLGTPKFMSPEQAEGRIEDIDSRSDIYSLGAILYNILTLQPPVTGDSAQVVIQKIRAGEIPPPTSFNQKERVRSRALQRGLEAAPPVQTNPALKRSTTNLAHCPGGRVPQSLSAVTMKAMALSQDARYQTVKELQQDIEAYQRGFATSAEQAGAIKLLLLMVKRHRVEFAVAAGALLILLGVAAGFLGQVITTHREAVATLDRLRATAPTLAARARSLVEAQQFDSALNAIDYALSLGGDEAGYLALRGNILQSLLRFGDAQDSYARALQRDKNNATATENLNVSRTILEENQGRSDLLPTSLLALQAAMQSQKRFTEAAAISRRLQQDKVRLYETWSAVLDRAGVLASLQKAGRQLKQDNAGLFELDLSGQPVGDVGFLRGMPLTSLRLDRTKVSDLSPLQGMRLKVLGLRETDVRDLSPVTGMPLEELTLDGCTQLADPRAIADCTQLERLTIPSHWKEIEFLRRCPNLESLSYRYDPNWSQAAEDFWKQFDATKR